MSSAHSQVAHRLWLFCTALICLMTSGYPALGGEPPTQPILRTETGMHTAPISAIDVDPSGRWLVSASRDKTVRVWDLSTIPLARKGAVDTEPPYDPAIAITRMVFGTSTKEPPKVGRPLDAPLMLSRILRPPIAPGGEGTLLTVAISPEGSFVATGGMTGAFGGKTAMLYLFSRSSGQLTAVATGLPHAVICLKFSPDGRYLAATLASGGLRIFAIDNALPSQNEVAAELRVLAKDEDYDGIAKSAHFSNDGKGLVTTSDDGFLRLYDLAKLHQITSVARSEQTGAAPLPLLPIEKKVAPGGKHPREARFSPDGEKIAVVFDDAPPKVNVLSARDLTLLYAPPLASAWASYDKIAWSPDGESLYASSMANKVTFSNIHKWTKSGRGPSQNFRASTKSILALAVLPNGSLVFGGDEPVIGLLTPKGNEHLLRQSGIVDHEGNLFRGIYLNPDGTSVRFAYDKLGAAPALFSITNRRLSLIPPKVENSNDAPAKASDADEVFTLPRTSAPGLVVKDWFHGNSPTLNGKRLELQASEFSKDLAIAPDNQSFVLLTNARLLMFGLDGSIKWQVSSLPEVPVSINIAAQNPLVAVAYFDGTIRWYSMKDGKELVAFFPHADKKRWVLWTPEGYFDASDSKTDLIGYHLNQGRYKEARFITMQALYDVFYRPDIIQAKLQGEDVSGLMTVTADEALKNPPPEVKFTSLPAKGAGKTTTICYQVKSTGGGIGEVRLFQNGKLIKSDGFYRELAKGEVSRGTQLASLNSRAIYQEQRSLIVKEKKGAAASIAKSKGDVIDQCTEIETMAGENEISLAAFNAPNTVQSFIETAAFTSTVNAEEPHLYLLAVGIDNYRNKSIGLKYAAKDANDFAAQLPKKARSIYRADNIHVTCLTDANAGKNGILNAINELSAKIKHGDSFIFFNASHGVMIQNQYFMVTADFDGVLDNNNALISSNEIVEISKRIKSLSQLFIFDTCHAGGVDNIISALYDARMVNLARKMGLHIYASAGSVQAASDGYQGNGLYTSTLLHGINNGKLVDKENSGMVTIKSLGLYTKEKPAAISATTGNRQTPVIINFGRDNTLFKVR